MSHMLDLSGESFAALRLRDLQPSLFYWGQSLRWFCDKTPQLGRHLDDGSDDDFISLSAHIALQRFEPYLSSKPLAEKILTEFHPSDRVMIYGDQLFGSSLLFYLQRPIELVNGKSSTMWFGSRFPMFLKFT